MENPSPSERYTFFRSGTDLIVNLQGHWNLKQGLSSIDKINFEICKDQKPSKITLRLEGLLQWDTSLLTFLILLRDYCSTKKIEFNPNALPASLQKLLSLSKKRENTKLTESTSDESFLANVGNCTINLFKDLINILTFIGETTFAFVKLIGGRAQTRWVDFMYIVKQVGVDALPIVSLISLLTGIIMAYVGSVQLEKFGATIYIADLVGLAMVREMGAMMTGIIMAARTGAAYAATIGSMKVTEELDALKTTSISPIDFLVIPRVLALFLMMPLLVVYSNFMGIVGGFFIAVNAFELSFSEYYNETAHAITMTDISTGLYKSLAFGLLISTTGCLRGMQCGTDASSVGDATTSAVVTGITSIIIADSIFAVIFNAFGM